MNPDWHPTTDEMMQRIVKLTVENAKLRDDNARLAIDRVGDDDAKGIPDAEIWRRRWNGADDLSGELSKRLDYYARVTMRR